MYLYINIYVIGASLVAQIVKRLPAIREPGFDPLVRKIPWRRNWQSTPALLPGKSMDGGAWRVTVHGVAQSTSLSLFTFMHWRRQWQPTSVFLPGESQGWQSLVGCHLWGHTESDTTEAT